MSVFANPASIPFACLGVSLLLGLPLRLALDRFRILDQPNQRSSHTRPTARGGGIGIMAAILFGCFLISQFHTERLLWSVPAVCCGVAIVSLIDDVRGLSAAIRFGTHLVGAALLLVLAGFAGDGGIGIHRLQTDFPLVPPVLLVPILLVGVVGYTNSFNFMDGINGIAASQAGITALGMAAIGGTAGHWDSTPVLVSLAVGGASLGFLPHNFPKARMFMGDVGSAPIGMLLAFLVIWICRDHGFHLLIPLALLHANFVLDTAITLVRRIAKGENWLQPHREHFYQRLIRSGKSHAYVTGCEAGLLLVTTGMAVATANRGLAPQGAAVILVLAIWGGFFRYAEKRFQRTQLASVDAKVN
jgi:UDP-N-acetylmuramyl pentapeptide phosphotransferase/UDP-N-acetylglucosamine-1-phosphate transferase